MMHDLREPPGNSGLIETPPMRFIGGRWDGHRSPPTRPICQLGERLWEVSQDGLITGAKPVFVEFCQPNQLQFLQPPNYCAGYYECAVDRDELVWVWHLEPFIPGPTPLTAAPTDLVQ
jgi:hypothetical protein